MKHRYEKLFAALARAAERRLSEFNVQGVANTAWASAIVKHRDEKLFSALAGAKQRIGREPLAQELPESSSVSSVR